MHGIHQPEVGRAALRLAALVGWLVPLVPGVARADHDHHTAPGANHAGHAGHEDAPEFSAGLAVVAAEFETRLYVGSYQGITPSLSWMRGRFGASAMIGLYHITGNGLSRYGPGDAMATGHATVVATEAVQAGVALHVMCPTGSRTANLGMGHVMAMPSLWATWRMQRVTLRAGTGYGRALTTLDEDHEHGLAPLVDPMNMQELIWNAGVDVDVGHGLRIGGRTAGGVPIGSGVTRAAAGGRLAWGTPRLSTALEVQVGVAGDPFTVRGVLDTALRF